MTAVQQFTKPFKRLFDKPLDIDQVFNTLVDMDAYLSSGNRYAGQIVSCLETNAVYTLNETKDTWIKSGGDDIHDRLHAMDSAEDHAAASEEDYGKFIRANPDTGKIEYVSPPIGDKNFVLTVYSINNYILQHNLGKYPAVQLKCSDSKVIISDIEHIDINTIKLTFEQEFSGTIILN